MKLLILLSLCFVVSMWCYAIYIALYLAHKRGEMTMTWLVAGLVPLLIGYVLDVLLFNWIIATLVLRELPKERTFSARLNRWHRQGSTHKYVMWWSRQLNALTPAWHEHIHNHDRPGAPD